MSLIILMCCFYVSRPGSIQARGENLFRIIKAFTNSSKLQNKYQTNYSEVRASLFNEERAVFFDFLSWFMVCTDTDSNIIFKISPSRSFVFLYLYCRFSDILFQKGC